MPLSDCSFAFEDLYNFSLYPLCLIQPNYKQDFNRTRLSKYHKSNGLTKPPLTSLKELVRLGVNPLEIPLRARYTYLETKKIL